MRIGGDVCSVLREIMSGFWHTIENLKITVELGPTVMARVKYIGGAESVHISDEQPYGCHLNKKLPS